jgi:hypothetical protein
MIVAIRTTGCTWHVEITSLQLELLLIGYRSLDYLAGCPVLKGHIHRATGSRSYFYLNLFPLIELDSL